MKKLDIRACGFSYLKVFESREANIEFARSKSVDATYEESTTKDENEES